MNSAATGARILAKIKDAIPERRSKTVRIIPLLEPTKAISAISATKIISII